MRAVNFLYCARNEYFLRFLKTTRSFTYTKRPNMDGFSEWLSNQSQLHTILYPQYSINYNMRAVKYLLSFFIVAEVRKIIFEDF